MASVELKSVSKVFHSRNGEAVYALTNFDLHVADRELVVLAGPSGCGKTTTLRLIAGLEEPTAGSISINQIAMNGVQPQDRDIAMVFQRDALYPHMSVFENLAFGLQLRRAPADEIATRVKATAATLGIAGVLDRFPRELSGGQRQRVALGRAVVRNPKVLLLDEPLSHLDAPTRTEMRREISRVHRQANATVIYVTHDQAEAMTLGQRIVVLREGVVQQIADPMTIYRQPANMFVAGFMGSPPMNLFRGRVVPTGEHFVFEEHNPAAVASSSRLNLALPAERGRRLSRFAEGNVVLGIRPEHVALDGSATNDLAWKPLVENVELLGAETLVHFNTGAHTFVARVEMTACPQPGERVPLHFDLGRTWFFNPASGTPII